MDASWSWLKIYYQSNNKNKDPMFYVIKLTNKTEVFYKFGLTFRSIKGRYSGCPYNYEIIYIKRDTPENLYRLEKSYKKNFKKYQYTPKIKFHGKTECFKL